MSTTIYANYLEAFNAIRAAGVAKLMVKAKDDAAYYNLGAPRDLKHDLVQMTKVDSILRPRSWGYMNDISCTCLQAGVAEIEALPQLILNQLVSIKMQSLDLMQFVATEIAGVTWKLHSDGDFNDFRRIEYGFRHAVSAADVDSFFLASTDGSIPADGTPDAGDALYSLAQTLVPAHQVGNGLSKLEFRATSADDTWVSVDFREAKYTFELVGDTRRGASLLPAGHTIKLTMDALILNTGLDNINSLALFHDNETDTKMTHVDGVVCELPAESFTVTVGYKNEGDAMKERVLPVHIEGSLTINEDGDDFVCADGTTWAGMWS